MSCLSQVLVKDHQLVQVVAGQDIFAGRSLVNDFLALAIGRRSIGTNGGSFAHITVVKRTGKIGFLQCWTASGRGTQALVQRSVKAREKLRILPPVTAMPLSRCPPRHYVKPPRMYYPCKVLLVPRSTLIDFFGRWPVHEVRQA